MRLAWLLSLALPAVLAASVYTGALSVPERYNPWAPLDVAAEPNLLTGFKLRQARGTPERCLAALALSALDYEKVPDRRTGEGCGFANAVRLRRGSGLSLASPVVLSCGAALSFAMWERHALEPAASRHLGAPLVSIEHLGSYACRNVNTGEGGAIVGRRSRHATADAFDVAGFTRGDRRRISVLRDWRRGNAEDPADAEALFLREAHAGACRFFDGVLGPDYNAVHANHLHLEVGGWRTCR